MISLITFWRGVAPGWFFSPFRCGSNSPWTNSQTLAFCVLAQSRDSGAAQSRQRYGASSGRRETHAQRLGFLGLVRLPLVEDAQEQNPSQFRDVLQRPGAIGAAHDVADGFHRGVQRLLRAVALAVGVRSGTHLV